MDEEDSKQLNECEIRT